MAVTEQKLGLDDWICASLMMVIKLRKTGLLIRRTKTFGDTDMRYESSLVHIWDPPYIPESTPSQGAAGRHISMSPNRQADLRQPRKLRDGLANKKRPCHAAAASSSCSILGSALANFLPPLKWTNFRDTET